MNGTWEGTLASVDIGQGVGNPVFIRLIIQDRRVRVFNSQREIKPGLFQIQSNLTNAVISAIQSGKDDDGRWVETWTVVVTQKDKNTMTAHWLRVVNNNDMPRTSDGATFSYAATGEMQRK